MFLQKSYTTKYEKLKAVMICTFLWGFAAHGFAFANLNLSHDSLNEFYLMDSAAWKIQLARFSEPFLRILMGEYNTLPWLAGIVSLLSIGGAAYLTLEIFGLSSLLEIALLTGIYTTNVTVTSCIATYAHDLAGDMVALLLSVCTVVFWIKCSKSFSLYAFGAGIVSTAIVLGFYQSYLSVSIVLIMIYSIMQLLNGEKAGKVFKNGIFSIIILAAGFVLYFLTVKIVCAVTGIPMLENNYNSLSNMWTDSSDMLSRIVVGYLTVVWGFVVPAASGPDKSALRSVLHPSVEMTWLYLRSFANLCLILIALVIFVKRFVNRKVGGLEKALTLLLVALLPFAMELAFITSGTSHDLMHFSYWLCYLFAGLLIKESMGNKPIVNRPKLKKAVSVIAIVAAAMLLHYNVETANSVYVKKDLENDAALATMTRVLDKIEEQESYVYGETQVAFIGGPSVQKGVRGMGAVSYITGVWKKSPITYPETYQKYFDNVLQYEIHVCDPDQIKELQELDEVKAMPAFPRPGSVQTIDGIIVVKMLEEEPTE